MDESGQEGQGSVGTGQAVGGSSEGVRSPKKLRGLADPVLRAKALAVRRANKAAKEAKLAVRKTNQVTLPIGSPAVKQAFDWETCPVLEAIQKLADFKREYDRVAQIVIRRQSIAPAILTCWSQEHKSLVPKSILAVCRKTIPDGRWVSRDDGAFIMQDGIKLFKPAVCCSVLCDTAYRQSRSVTALSRS